MNFILSISLVYLFGVNLTSAWEDLILAPGGRLDQGQTVSSANGECKLLLQGDGNLIVRKNGNSTWSSGSFNVAPFNTHANVGPFFLKLQRGGAMVIKDDINGDVIYSTRTRNMPLDNTLGGLFFNEDCSITVKANNDHYDLWTNVRTKFYGGNRLDNGEMIKYPINNPQYTLILQNDGNLILFEGVDRSDYDGAQDIIWGAGVTSDAGADKFFLKFTCDGRLVLKEVINNVSVTYWSMSVASTGSGSGGTTAQGYSLILQSDDSTPFGYDPIDAACQTESYTQERFVRPI